MGDAAVRDATITLNGLRFHYRDWGDPAAPPLLLLHGALCHAHMFDSLAARMSDRYRVLALDQRGHGETDWASDYQHARVAEDGAAFIAALGLGRVALVGFSFGGDTALAFAAAQPGRVTRLVLYETAVTDAPAPRTREALLRWRGVPALVDDPDEAERLLREQIPRADAGELRAFVRAGL